MQIRLFIPQPNLAPDINCELNKSQSHYLKNVLRLKISDQILIFNNKNGEFKAIISRLDKYVTIKILEKTQEFYLPPQICLAFAPVKNVKTEYIITKATELGVTHIYPIITTRTIVNKINLNKLLLNAIEAAEQCRRTDLPHIDDIIKLSVFLNDIKNSDHILIFADESGAGDHPHKLFQKLSNNNDILYQLSAAQKIIILIGPEGGFSEQERNLIRNYHNCYSMSLGKEILRADTAIISGLSLVKNYVKSS